MINKGSNTFYLFYVVFSFYIYFCVIYLFIYNLTSSRFKYFVKKNKDSKQ